VTLFLRFAMSAAGSGQNQFARDVVAQPYLFPYNSQASKQPGSRTRLLNAAILCCNDQYLLTLRNLEDAHFPVSELHWYLDNDVSAITKLNLNEKVYKKFVEFAWGCDHAAQLLLQ
jgi:hypothetical protein